MKTRLSSALLLILGAFTIVHCYGGDSGANRVVKAAKNDALIEVSVPAAAKQGDAVVMVFKLTNQGKNGLYYTVPPGGLGLGIVILDSKNRDVPLTQLGGKTLIGYGHDGFRDLAPGKSLEYKISLGDYFKLIPGKYTLSTGMQIGVPLSSSELSDMGHVKEFELFVEGVAFEIE